MWPDTRRAARSRSLCRATPAGSAVVVALLVLSTLAGFDSAVAGEAVTNSAAVAAETNSQETLRAYLQLQEQLHLTQLAIEQNRREARDTAAQNSDLLAGRLQTIEKALESQRTRELSEMQTSNRSMLVVAGTFAGIGFLAMFLMAFFQWRTVNRLTEISGTPAGSRLLGGGPTLETGGIPGPQAAAGQVERSSVRLLGALDQLEKRLNQLENTTHTPLAENIQSERAEGRLSLSSGNGSSGESSSHHGPETNGHSAESERINVLLGKGQSMLSLDDPQSAIACFEEVLTLDPKNAEAWVRKGAALERLQQLDQAIDCYDHAIAADGSMTIAYLHKGGLFNRMERFNDALDCYEKALRTQEKLH